MITLKRTLETLKRTLKRDYWIKSRNKPLGRNINSKTQEFQRQLFEDFLQNRCFWKLRNIHRKTPVAVLKSLLIKLQAFRPANLLKRDSNTVVFLWILRNFLRTAFPIERLWWLLLELRDFLLFAIYATLKIYEDS